MRRQIYNHPQLVIVAAQVSGGGSDGGNHIHHSSVPEEKWELNRWSAHGNQSSNENKQD
jgi:hypothetical protein